MAQKNKANIEETLTDLLDKIAQWYKKKVQDNDLSAAEQKNVVQLLRDNHITVDPTKSNPLSGLLDETVSEEELEGFH